MLAWDELKWITRGAHPEEGIKGTKIPLDTDVLDSPDHSANKFKDAIKSGKKLADKEKKEKEQAKKQEEQSARAEKQSETKEQNNETPKNTKASNIVFSKGAKWTDTDIKKVIGVYQGDNHPLTQEFLKRKSLFAKMLVSFEKTKVARMLNICSHANVGISAAYDIESQGAFSPECNLVCFRHDIDPENNKTTLMLESSHSIDCFYGGGEHWSSKNKNFISALKEAETQFAKWADSAEFVNSLNRAAATLNSPIFRVVLDIIDALGRGLGEPRPKYGHKIGYWEKDNNQRAEIFAELLTLYCFLGAKEKHIYFLLKKECPPMQKVMQVFEDEFITPFFEK